MDEAKLLFIRLVYGGGVAGWAEACGVDAGRLPVFAHSFAHEQGQIRAKDIEGSLELLAVIGKNRSTEDSQNNDRTLESYMNMKWEREALNELECIIKRIGGVVCSWECDGFV